MLKIVYSWTSSDFCYFDSWLLFLCGSTWSITVELCTCAELVLCLSTFFRWRCKCVLVFFVGEHLYVWLHHASSLLRIGPGIRLRGWCNMLDWVSAPQVTNIDSLSEVLGFFIVTEFGLSHGGFTTRRDILVSLSPLTSRSLWFGVSLDHFVV